MSHAASPNPWAATAPVRHARLGGLTGVLDTASSLGHAVPGRAAPAPPASAASLDLLDSLTNLAAARQRQRRAEGDAGEYAAAVRTRDVTYGDDVRRKVALLGRLLEHVETVVEEKETLVARLSKPFSSGGLAVERQSQAAFLATLQLVVEQLAHFSANMDLLAWMRTATLEEIRADRTFAAMEASMARLQQYNEVLMATRKRFHDYDVLVRGEQ